MLEEALEEIPLNGRVGPEQQQDAIHTRRPHRRWWAMSPQHFRQCERRFVKLDEVMSCHCAEGAVGVNQFQDIETE